VKRVIRSPHPATWRSPASFVDLELRGGFGLPDDIDDSFTTTVDLVIDAIATHSRTQETRTPK
jgi:hypothetical protein